jgi:hypothetical protein
VPLFRLAGQVLRDRPGQKVLVVGWESMTGFLSAVRPEDGKAKVVASALFGDGCGAALLGDGDHEPGPAVLATAVHQVPGTLNHIRLEVGEEDSYAEISREKPVIAETGLAPLVDDFLRARGLDRDAIDHWVLHPGGPAIITSFLADTLHHTSHALAGVPAFAAFSAAVAAQLAAGAWAIRRLLVTGLTALSAGLSLVVAATWLPSLALFVAGGVIAGAGAGLLFKGSLVTASGLGDPRRRAEVLAGFFLAGYLGLSIPVLGLGILGQVIAPRVALLAFALLVLAGIAASARSLPRGARTGTPGPSRNSGRPPSLRAGGSRHHLPSIVSVRFAYAFSSNRYPTAQTALGPPAAAPVTNGFDDAGVVSRVQDVPSQRRTSGAPLDRPTAMTVDGDSATTSVSSPPPAMVGVVTRRHEVPSKRTT